MPNATKSDAEIKAGPPTEVRIYWESGANGDSAGWVYAARWFRDGDLLAIHEEGIAIDTDLGEDAAPQDLILLVGFGAATAVYPTPRRMVDGEWIFRRALVADGSLRG